MHFQNFPHDFSLHQLRRKTQQPVALTVSSYWFGKRTRWSSGDDSIGVGGYQMVVWLRVV